MNLDVLKNNNLVAQFDLGEELTGESDQVFQTLVGRGENCFLKLDDRLVSREHAIIRYADGKWVFENLSKTRPTLDENHNAVDKVELNQPKKLLIGEFILNFYDGNSSDGDSIQETDSSNDSDESAIEESIDEGSEGVEASGADGEQGSDDEEETENFSEGEDFSTEETSDYSDDESNSMEFYV